jgi:type 1 glutamine amidotransferase
MGAPAASSPAEAAPMMGGRLSAPASGGGGADGKEESTTTAGNGSEGPTNLPLTPSADPAPGGATPSPSVEPADGSGQNPGAAEQMPQPAPARLQNVLVFTRTISFRHDSIEAGVQMLQRLGQDNGFAVQRTEDPADFNDQGLARYDVVVWLSTDGEVMTEPGRRAFERYIRAGGGWVGIHAANASEYNWAWYGQLIGGGAFFLNHPPIQSARVNVEIADHPSTMHLPRSFTVTDELYSFRANPRSSVRVLMTLDESSYAVGNLAMGDHPIAWYHEFEGGRAWYTALGHPSDWYSDPMFTRHVLGGLQWAASVVH